MFGLCKTRSTHRGILIDGIVKKNLIFRYSHLYVTKTGSEDGKIGHAQNTL